MARFLEVPDVSLLGNSSIEVRSSGDPGVTHITSWANDGSVVVLSWDELACSAHVLCTVDGAERVSIERESASRISVDEDQGVVKFSVWCGVEGLVGRLVITVGESVTISDVLLSA